MKEKEKVTTNPGHTTWKPSQTITQVIPDYTEARSPLTHLYDRKTCNTPLVYIYNTRSRIMKGHNIMDNHVEKFQSINPPNIAVPT